VANAGLVLVFQTLSQNSNARALVGAHQRWLLQEFRDIAVLRDIPADHGLQRYLVHSALGRYLARHRRIERTFAPGELIREGTAWIVRVDRSAAGVGSAFAVSPFP